MIKKWVGPGLRERHADKERLEQEAREREALARIRAELPKLSSTGLYQLIRECQSVGMSRIGGA